MASKLSAVPSNKFVIVTVIELKFVLSISVKVASLSATATAPASSVKVAAKSEPPVLASRSKTGASLTPKTVRVVAPVLLLALPSLAINVIERAVVLGFCEVLLYVTVRKTVW